MGLLNLGSAVWIAKSGYLATCYHVVKGRESLRIAFPGDPHPDFEKHMFTIRTMMDYAVELVDFDESKDVAILKATITPDKIKGRLAVAPEKPALPAVLETKLPDFKGEPLFLAGYPLDGLTLIVQTGPATGMSVTEFQGYPYFRIVISLVSNPGNSGGPVLNAEGKLVGLLEGNLQSLVPDPQTHLPLICGLPKIDPQNGQIVKDSEGPVVVRRNFCMQNSGISYAVPARFIQDVADKKHIKLD
jgi:S1-C subfamily serine protease